ncbi:hypothetical protein [Janthinobacterium sp. 61]|uniref:hypothetical protein n=1 Tax=Janthinobacterium sp. 61 TaxID=2035209 RepID=UPI00117B34EB|nr:hypothetical protein [Janthinobacterium sp. 61]
MYRWLFNRRRRRTSFLALDLPLYYNAAVTIAINNPGGIAKCGMCCIGPIEEIGGTEYGLGRDFKDWSTTKFNFDGYQRDHGAGLFQAHVARSDHR